MDQQDLHSFIQRIQMHQADFQDTISQLTQAVIELNEENNRLRMLNHDLEERLNKQTAKQTESTVNFPSEEPKNSQSTGKDRLQSFYEDGIHVCHELFGKRRHSSEDCLFCQDVLIRLEQGRTDG